MRYEAERGQTMPFWLGAIGMTLALLFFVADYVQMIGWQIRAQNAADSAAAGAVSVTANVFNEESTILYAAAVDEYRIREINQAILNTINSTGAPGQCNPAPGGTCDQDYQVLVQELNQLAGNASNNAFARDIMLLQRADNFTQAGQQNASRQVVQQWGQCTNVFTDCKFTYNIVGDTLNGTGKKSYLQSVDVIACRLVQPVILGFKISAPFFAIGRSASGVVSPTLEVFNPGARIFPTTNAPYQPVESGWALQSGVAPTVLADPDPPYNVDFSGLNVNLYWYGDAPSVPFSANTIVYTPSLNNTGADPNQAPTGAYGCDTNA